VARWFRLCLSVSGSFVCLSLSKTPSERSLAIWRGLRFAAEGRAGPRRDGESAVKGGRKKGRSELFELMGGFRIETRRAMRFRNGSGRRCYASKTK